MNLDTRFDLAALAKGRTKRKAVAFRPILPRLASEQAFIRIIMSVMRHATDRKAKLLEAATFERRALTADVATITSVMREMREAFDQATTLARGPLQSLFAGDARRHDERWIDQVNRLIGVDLTAVVRANDTRPAIELAVQQNVALIKGLSDDVAKRIEVTILDMVSQGKSNRDIAKALTDIGGFTKRRAEFIARDQAASFNGALTEIRQKQAGVRSYTWQTVGDQRVRPAHRSRNGRVFRWDSPPSDGHPGRAPRCRCVAVPVLELEDEPRSSRVRASREGLAAVASALGLGR